jgi:hypothetical protein
MDSANTSYNYINCEDNIVSDRIVRERKAYVILRYVTC